MPTSARLEVPNLPKITEKSAYSVGMLVVLSFGKNDSPYRNAVLQDNDIFCFHFVFPLAADFDREHSNALDFASSLTH